MPVNILMPALSPTMEKGNLAKWLKKEGDKVKAGDVIAEIETDKATMEYEAIDEGMLAKIVVPEGTAGRAGQPAHRGAGGGGRGREGGGGGGREGGAAARSAAAGDPPPACEHAAAPRRAAAGRAAVRRQQAGRSSPGGSGARRPRAAGSTAWRQPRLLLAARAPARQGGRHRPRAHPGLRPAWPRHRARRRGGEIGQGAGAPRRSRCRRRRRCRSQAPSDDKIRALFEPGSYEVVPHDNIRKVIARRLVEAKLTIPHFYLTLDCNIGKLLAAREEINAAAPKDKDGKPAYKISVNDFVIKALALALQRVPDANVTWTEGGMLKHKHSDIGVAVVDPGRADHAGRAPGRDEVAVGHLQRDEGLRRARAGAQAQAGGISGRHQRGVEPRHVRDQGFRRGDQSAARDHPRGRRRRGAGGRARTARSRRRMDDVGDALDRPPRGRRRARRASCSARSRR